VIICSTENFNVVASDRPHVDRLDGGHVKILPIASVGDRTELKPAVAEELMLLTMLVGRAMALGLNRRGIDVGRINYQDNGNWGVFRSDGPHLHVHLYGRARSARVQVYGDALFLPHREPGFYDDVTTLDGDDIAAIREDIQRLLKTEKYRLLSITLHLP